MNRTSAIDKKQLNRKLRMLAVPIALQGVVSATLSLVDNLMVGFLGETELAAVGVAAQIFMIFHLVNFGMMGGFATFSSQFYGAADKANIRKVIGLAMTVLFGTGVLFFAVAMLKTETIIGFYTKDPAVQELAVQYVRINARSCLLLGVSGPLEMGFRSTQQTKVPLVVSTVTFSTNTILNYILIFGKFGAPRLGVAGAAIATVTARFLEIGINVFCATRKWNYYYGPIKSFFGGNGELVKRIIKNATPTTVNELLWSLGQTMYVAAFNRIGTTEYAAYQAANIIANVFSFAGFSIGDAALIMIGEKLGEGDKDYTWEMSKHILKVGVIMGAIIGGIVMIAAYPMTNLFNLTPDGKSYAFKILMLIGLTTPISIYGGIHITGTLRGGGDTRFAMLAESGCVWLVAVPLAFLGATVWHLPIHWCFILIRIEEVVKGIILTWRYLSKKWMNTVIRDID